MAQQLSSNTFTVAKWIVSADPTQGTHTTIQGAINSASSGDTIWIRSGTYTENLTLKAGVALSAKQGSDRIPTVIIVGNATFTGAGSVSFASIRLQTNGSFCLSVTGAAASVVTLISCYLNITNNTGISFTSSNAAAAINIVRSALDIGTTGIAIYSSTSPGTISFRYTNTTNSGGTSTASTNSGGLAEFLYCNLLSPLSCSGSGNFNMFYSSIDTSVQNATCISVLGTSTSVTNYNTFSSGTASAITVGGNATFNLIRSTVTSSNASAVVQSASGVLKTGFITFLGTSAGIGGTLTTLAGHWMTGNSINMSNDANASTINLGTGAAVKTLTLGSTNTTSKTTIQSGSLGTVLSGYTGIVTANNTSPITVSTVTQYGTVIAGTSNSVSSVAPSATSGVPFISQGAAANPVFGTAVVAGGGTGATTFTAYAVLTGGTTATGALQSIASVGTATQVLTSNGAAALPTFQAAAFVAPTIVKSVITQASAVSLTTGVSANITSISLTAGTWSISAIVMNNSTLTTNMSAAISTVSATNPTNLGDNVAFNGGANVNSATIVRYAVTPGSTTTYYLVGLVTGTGTLTGWGHITAYKFA